METDLIVVTVVVLAVNFMGAVFAGGTDNLLTYGGGMALVIESLGLFVVSRAWAHHLDRESSADGEKRSGGDRPEKEING